MKIAYDYQIFAAQKVGGISRYFAEIASRIACEPDMTATVFALAAVNQYLHSVPKLRFVGFSRPESLPNSVPVLQSVNLLNRAVFPGWLGLYQPNVVHETYYRRGVKLPKSVRRVLTVYDFTHEKFKETAGSKEHSAWKTKAIERADHIICISESTKRDMLERYTIAPEQISVTYLGCSLIGIQGSKPKELVRPYILYVGNRLSYKNFERCLRAYAASSRLMQDFDLVCFGESPFTEEETNLMSALNISPTLLKHYRGNDTDLAGFYRGASCFIYPSLYEGFGIPPLEAMSQDCPVVCSNTSSLPEVGGDAVEYFDPMSVEGIGQALENVLYSPTYAAQLVSRGRSRLANFTWDQCAKNTASIYRSLF